jgi:hypothetical protein
MSISLLTATTSAAQSADHIVTGINRAGGTHAHFTAPGIAGSEVATVQKKNSDGSYSDYYIGGTIQTISATQTGVVVDAAGIYRIDKDATAASVGIEVSTPDSP